MAAISQDVRAKAAGVEAVELESEALTDKNALFRRVAPLDELGSCLVVSVLLRGQ